ncbi:MAG: hypothetical protein Q7T18_03490 [Sedimentisphaerales bacterium]|nr:hypothetical protein [Sedimentisphaerales bacterium]
MRMYHPIQWVEHIQWHEVFMDKRLWAAAAIIGFVALFTFLVVLSAQSGTTPMMPYGGPWPYGPTHFP